MVGPPTDAISQPSPRQNPGALVVVTYTPNSYSHDCAKSLVEGDPLLEGAQIQLVGNSTQVVDRLLKGAGDYGIVSFFNIYASTTGVPLSYRLLLANDIFVHRIVRFPIQICLAGRSGMEVADVQTIFAMSVLEPQCSEFIESQIPKARVDTTGIENTPAAMAKAAKAGFGSAAIGNVAAAHDHGLRILAEAIENSGNETSFFLISTRPILLGPERLVCFEVESGVDEGRVVADVVAPLLKGRDWLAFDHRIEDKAKTGEQNHLIISHALNPLQNSLDSDDPRILTCKVIGSPGES